MTLCQSPAGCTTPATAVVTAPNGARRAGCTDHIRATAIRVPDITIQHPDGTTETGTDWLTTWAEHHTPTGACTYCYGWLDTICYWSRATDQHLPFLCCDPAHGWDCTDCMNAYLDANRGR